MGDKKHFYNDLKLVDSHRLHISTPGVQLFGTDAENMFSFPRPIVESTGEASPKEDVLRIIEEKVRKNGTMKEISIFAHGDTGIMYPVVHWWKDMLNIPVNAGDTRFAVGEILDGISHIEEKLQTKVTDRMVFKGCNTLGDINSKEVKAFRGWARNHGTEIVGTTSYMVGMSLDVADWVRFTPNGEVKRDQLTPSDNNPILGPWKKSLRRSSAVMNSAFMKSFIIPEQVGQQIGDVDQWSKCHINRSQKDGEACQYNNREEFLKNLNIKDWRGQYENFVGPQNTRQPHLNRKTPPPKNQL